MVRKGFVEQQIETLAILISRLLGLKTSGDYNGAMIALRVTGKSLTGMDWDHLASLPERTILSLFMSEGKLDAGRCVVIAALLDEQGTIFALQGQERSAQIVSRKALALFLAALNQEDELRTGEWRDRTDALLIRLQKVELPPPMLVAAFHYYESVGQFGRAEDMLYALREKGDPIASQEGEPFYRRLLIRSDAELQAGNLSRDEVVEALAGLNDVA